MAAHAITLELMTLLDAPGVGPGRVRKLLKRWHTGSKTESLLEEGLVRATLTPPQVEALPKSRDRVERHWEELAKNNVRAITILDPAYPTLLKHTLGDGAPVLLFCVGNTDLFQRPAAGFCGSREATEKGLMAASDTADLLARQGINVVSGYAAGVDMHAHRAALGAGGSTTVVLAEGILRFRVKKEIREQWDPERVLVVSEFGPNHPWSISQAMQRNRTICGLSRALILIEARANGGSIEAGRASLKLGVPLFAAVYEGMPESATGNKEILQNGARPLMKSRTANRTNIRPVMDAIVPLPPRCG